MRNYMYDRCKIFQTGKIELNYCNIIFSEKLLQFQHFWFHDFRRNICYLLREHVLGFDILYTFKAKHYSEGKGFVEVGTIDILLPYCWMFSLQSASDACSFVFRQVDIFAIEPAGIWIYFWKILFDTVDHNFKNIDWYNERFPLEINHFIGIERCWLHNTQFSNLRGFHTGPYVELRRVA